MREESGSEWGGRRGKRLLFDSKRPLPPAFPLSSPAQSTIQRRQVQTGRAHPDMFSAGCLVEIASGYCRRIAGRRRAATELDEQNYIRDLFVDPNENGLLSFSVFSMVFEKPVKRLESRKALPQAIISFKCSADEYDSQDSHESSSVQV
ncbi:hypothetical protein HZH68_010618 [Vespula germanica]|uniref:Uncharacterized protein n=1 Tax=Vespula germanica TaxID=30212 RepID=A0A834N3N1_VESGE|nr:hypothetical protein HZH68_010618 [Vespula germanica]